MIEEPSLLLDYHKMYALYMYYCTKYNIDVLLSLQEVKTSASKNNPSLFLMFNNNTESIKFLK